MQNIDETEELLSSHIILKKYESYSPDTVYVSTKEAAAILNMSHRTLEKWRKTQKNLTFYRTTGKYSYKLSDLIAYMESRKVKALDQTFYHTFGKAA